MSPYAAESERLWLQSLSVEDHLDDYHEILSHPGAMLWSTQGVHKDLQETVDDMGKRIPVSDRDLCKTYAILLRPNSIVAQETERKKTKMIGIIGTKQDLTVAYKLHPDYWRKGYMSEALAMFLKMFWSLEENRCHCDITAFADPENVASCRLLEKMGFQKGNLMQNYYMRAVNRESRKWSNLQFFWLERPHATKHWVNEKKMDERKEVGIIVRGFWTENEESHDVLRESVKSMLADGGK